MGDHSGHRWLFFAGLTCVVAGVAAGVVALGSAGSHARTGLAWARQPDPVVFLRVVVRQLARNDYAEAWLTLDPEQQRSVPQAEYVRCESASPIPGRLARLEVLRVFGEPVNVPGRNGAPILSKAVTFRIVITEPSLRTSVVIRHTVHAIRVEGRWAWMLPARRFELHRSGRCLAAPPVGGGPSA